MINWLLAVLFYTHTDTQPCCYNFLWYHTWFTWLYYDVAPSIIQAWWQTAERVGAPNIVPILSNVCIYLHSYDFSHFQDPLTWKRFLHGWIWWHPLVFNSQITNKTDFYCFFICSLNRLLKWLVKWYAVRLMWSHHNESWDNQNSLPQTARWIVCSVCSKSIFSLSQSQSKQCSEQILMNLTFVFA